MLKYVPHRKLSLRGHPELNEKWLQAKIVEDPRILGLGDLDVKDVERSQPRGGRLDMLLYDDETNTRYEVEVQLGGTDESHIIRTIEYWDIERRRYPQYEHVGVIVAEEITARFFNVISLFNGFIPLVAIHVSAIEVADDAVTLVFTRVLDQMPLGPDEPEPEPVDRSYWVGRSGAASVALTDRLFELVREMEPNVDLKYNKHYIGVARDGVPTNFVTFRPRRKRVVTAFRNPRSDELSQRLEDAGMEELTPDRLGTYRLALSESDLNEHADLIRELVKLSHHAYGASS